MSTVTITLQHVTATFGIMKASGGIDIIGYRLLEEELSNLMSSTVTSLVVDFTELTAISAAALGALVRTAAALKERGGKMACAAPPGSVSELIGLLGLEDTIPVAATMDAARKLATSK